MQVASQLPPQNLIGGGEVFVDRNFIQDNASLPTQGMTLVNYEVGQSVITNQTGLTGQYEVGQPLLANPTALPGQLNGNVLQQGILNNQAVLNGPNHLHQGGALGPAPLIGTAAPINNGAPVNVQNIGTGTPGTNYSGTYTFRLMEGRFFKDHDWLTKMDPYVKIKIGPHIGRSVVAKKQGTTPYWNDVIKLERKHLGNFAKIKVKDRDRLSLNDRIGETRIPLSEIAVKGRVTQWFPVYKKDEKTGDILMEVMFQPVI